MHSVPGWLQTAFAEWLTGRLYVDSRGNYRRRIVGSPRHVVTYNRPLKRVYPRNDEFHRAAHRWLVALGIGPDCQTRRRGEMSTLLSIVMVTVLYLYLQSGARRQ